MLQASESIKLRIANFTPRSDNSAYSAYRWVDYHDFPIEKEKDYIRKGITSLKALTGYAP